MIIETNEQYFFKKLRLKCGESLNKKTSQVLAAKFLIKNRK